MNGRKMDTHISGNALGGQKAREANLKKDPDFYKKLGRKGGKKTGVMKGFAANPELAARVGQKAGKISKRGHTFVRTEGEYNVYIAKDTGNVVKYKHEGRN